MFYNAKMSTKISTSRKKIVLVKKKIGKKLQSLWGRRMLGEGLISYYSSTVLNFSYFCCLPFKGHLLAWWVLSWGFYTK